MYTANPSRYIFSPRIDGFIDTTEATLSLATSCIIYLCQRRYGLEILDDKDEVANQILSGGYRFHYFSTTLWLELVERYVRLTRSQVPPKELINLLELLVNERSSYEFDGSIENFSQPAHLQPFQPKWPDLHNILCNAAHFRQKCLQAEYHIGKGM